MESNICRSCDDRLNLIWKARKDAEMEMMKGGHRMIEMCPAELFASRGTESCGPARDERTLFDVIKQSTKRS